MMNQRIMKKSVFGLVIALLISSTAFVFASNNNYGYSFKLKANYANSYSSARYRQTSNENNKWKVNMTYNSEGKGCKATYWLAKDNKSRTVASNTHAIKQGSGAHYYKATAVASKTNVRLGAENNNNTACSVSGYWDEETE